MVSMFGLSEKNEFMNENLMFPSNQRCLNICVYIHIHSSEAKVYGYPFTILYQNPLNFLNFHNCSSADSGPGLLWQVLQQLLERLGLPGLGVAVVLARSRRLLGPATHEWGPAEPKGRI